MSTIMSAVHKFKLTSSPANKSEAMPPNEAPIKLAGLFISLIMETKSSL